MTSSQPGGLYSSLTTPPLVAWSPDRDRRGAAPPSRLERCPHRGCPYRMAPGEALPGDLLEKLLKNVGRPAVITRSLSKWLTNRQDRWADGYAAASDGNDGHKIKVWFIRHAE